MISARAPLRLQGGRGGNHPATKNDMKPSLDSLATIASRASMEAAADYIRANGLKDGPDYNIDNLVVALRRHAKSALDIAMRDAREALACGMDQVAVATFTASFRLAGIAAAKEACGH